MEVFILASVSLIIAVSLLIAKQQNHSMRAFAALCCVIFLNRAGYFFFEVFDKPFWRTAEFVGLLALPPCVLYFVSALTRGKSPIRKRMIFLTALTSSLLAVLIISPLQEWIFSHLLLYLYASLILVIAYLFLIIYTLRTTHPEEKKRLAYLVIAVAAAAFLCCFDLFSYFGIPFPLLSDIVIAALLYFILLVIAYPHLTKLYELMAKSLMVFILSAFATILVYFVLGILGKGIPLSVTQIFTISFLIVISITPIKMIVKRIFAYFYPASTDIFQSLYAFDEKLEREKTLLLEDMAPVLAHEIRNPLGSIKGAAQYLSTEMESKEHQKLLNVIIEEVNRLNRVVSQFLDYAKPYRIDVRREDVNRVVRKAISIIQSSGQTEHVNIKTGLTDDLPQVQVDAEQLIQVILNIAFNGLEAMGGKGELFFQTSPLEEAGELFVSLDISDTGTGISPKDMNLLFKPFFTTKERGIGLGLPICQRIIKEHGGKIRVKSTAATGTTFNICLRAG
jgi:signal transduction histidine kinase